MVNHPSTEFGGLGITAVAMFLICIMISRDLALKGVSDFMGGNPSR